MPKIGTALALAAALASAPALRATLFINEFAASNVLSFRNADGGYEDWIEIYNSGPAAVDLAGYAVSDDAALRSAWRIPAGQPSKTTVPARGYLVLIADCDTARSAGHLGIRLARERGRIALLAPDGATVVDDVSYAEQTADVSWGRAPSGAASWRTMSPPTPGAANGSGFAGVCAEPVIETAAGFFAGSVSVSVRPGDAGETVRYTLDGGDPEAASPAASAPVTVDRTAVFKARGFRDGWLPGPAATATYFVNEGSTLPALSLSTDPDNLYDPETGIYVRPGNDTDVGHDGREWERRAVLEYFPDRSFGFRMPGGIRTQGNSSPDDYAKQSYRIHFRDGYGDGRLTWPGLFPRDSVDSFRSLVLRAGYDDGLDPGDDDMRTGTLIRDPAVTELWRRTGYAVSQDRLTSSYLNGEYYGIIDLKETVDETFVRDHFGYADLDLMRTRWDSTELVYGSRAEWRSLLAFFDANTFETDARLAEAADRMDLDNYMTLQVLAHAVQFYSWSYGTFMFRERRPGARWRWTIWDADRAFMDVDWNGFTSAYNPTLVYLNDHITRKLLQNASYRNAAINRTADLLNTLFAPASVRSVVDSLAGLIREDAARDAARWGTTAADWEANVESIRDFADRRPAVVRAQTADYFHLAGTARLDLGIASGSGRIRVNSVVPGGLPWSGVYFKGVPVTLTALPDPGYRFAGWSGGNLPSSETAVWTPDGDASVSAVFLPTGPVNAELVAPSRVRPGHRMPVVVRIRDAGWNIDPLEQTPVRLGFGGTRPDTSIVVKRGAAVAWPSLGPAADFTLTAGNAAVPESRRSVSASSSRPTVSLSGTLPSGDVIWDAAFDRVVTGPLTVPAGCRLVIRPGTWVLLRKNAGITVRGSLDAEGTEADPVVFAPENDADAWGGIDFQAAAGTFRWCFLVRAGGDGSKAQPAVTPSSPSYEWHTGRQHILFANNRSTLTLDGCFFLYSPGKVMGAHFSRVTETNCVSAFVWHGGEYHWSRLFCRNSHFLNLPDDDPTYTGDIDTDGFHIDYRDPDDTEYSVIDRCWFVRGKDDAVDQHGARLRITNCWMEDIQHEGLAGSGGDTVRVFNTLVKDADTGFESAWTEGGTAKGPHVFVDHSAAINCRVAGLRIGDDYASRSVSEYRCTLTATNVVLSGNADNVMNWILSSRSSLPGAMNVTWSLTNDADADGLPHNLAGVPVFDANYFLQPGSPGYGMGSNGTDMGRQDSTALSSGTVLVDEIMYHAPPSADTGDWIELFNPEDRPRDLTGWTIKDDDDLHAFLVPAGAVIPAGGWWVICRDLNAFRAVHPGVLNSSGGLPFGLGGNDRVRLYAPSGAAVDVVAWDNGGAWPREADGGGSSLELLNVSSDNALPSNWAASLRTGGTPGAANRLPDAVSRESAPAAFFMGPNYPNPFNPSARIDYVLPRPGSVRLEVFDLRGRRVSVALDGPRLQAGPHRAAVDGRDLASGVYLYRMTVTYDDGRRDVRTRKMSLIR
jgi:hypothetical protein